MKVALIKVDEIPENGSTLIDFFNQQLHVFKVDGKPKAMLNICAHVGGPLEYHDCKFVCQWHGAEFSIDGQRTAAPAPRESKLMFLPTRVEDGVLNYVWGE